MGYAKKNCINLEVWKGEFRLWRINTLRKETDQSSIPDPTHQWNVLRHLNTQTRTGPEAPTQQALFWRFSPQSLYSGILLRASLWTRGRDPAMWSAFGKTLHLCVWAGIRGTHTKHHHKQQYCLFWEQSQIKGNCKATSKHEANVCCEFLTHVLAGHKGVSGNMAGITIWNLLFTKK